jgi:uncharacterized NAD(P)/FAD-binding protein YdhS
VSRSWFEINLRFIEAGLWDSVYLPRYLYGIFLQEKLRAAISQARSTGLASVSMIRAEAIEVAKTLQGSYRIQLEKENEDRSCIDASSILLAVGSPPYRALASYGADAGATNIITDPYSPNLTDNLECIKHFMSRASNRARNCLLVGANATALEILYHLHSILANAVDRFVVLSKGGQLPDRAGPASGRPINFMHLEQAASGSRVTADELFDALTTDIQAARRENRHINDIVSQVGPLLNLALTHADDDMAKAFQDQYGMRFTRLIRRAGHEYRDAADFLAARGKLEVLAGRLLHLDKATLRETITLDYVTINGSPNRHRLSFSVVVNCSGFEPVIAASSSRLIKSLITSGLCKPNASKRGFEVNERLEAAEKFFVIGPLLAGVFLPKMRYWHLENARRIRTASAVVARSIMKFFEQRAEQHAP